MGGSAVASVARTNGATMATLRPPTGYSGNRDDGEFGRAEGALSGGGDLPFRGRCGVVGCASGAGQGWPEAGDLHGGGGTGYFGGDADGGALRYRARFRRCAAAGDADARTGPGAVLRHDRGDGADGGRGQDARRLARG